MTPKDKVPDEVAHPEPEDEGEESDEYELEDEHDEEEGGYEDEVEDDENDESEGEEEEEEEQENLTALLLGGHANDAGATAEGEDGDNSEDYEEDAPLEQHIISAGALGSKKRSLEELDEETEGQQADDESSSKKTKT